LSFPKGNGQGVMYEPWHWRYEGSPAAKDVFQAAQ
jgi:zinc D-Ala-D-Ala carboxypeptidase